MLLQLQRIKNLQEKIELYDKIIRSKLEYDLDILVRLAQLDHAMSNFDYQETEIKQEDIITPNYYDLPEPTEIQEPEPESVPDVEGILTTVPTIHTIKVKRGRPKKKRY